MKKTSSQAPRRGPKGRVVDPQALQQVQALLQDAPREPALLIEFLHRIQDSYGHLSRAHMAALAQELKLAQVEVYEVASFYHHFDTTTTGEASDAMADASVAGVRQQRIRVCNGLSCRMAGSQALFENLVTKYRLPVRVIEVPCIGRCAEAPAACVGQNAFGAASVESVAAVIDAQAFAAPELSFPLDTFGLARYTTLAQCLRGQLRREQVMERLSQSGLRGLGGAGFPTGRKWQIVASQPGPRLMAVNIDEGEPGTFKDRWYLEQQPQAVLHGMLLAVWAVGIEAVYIYLRDEYHAIRAMLERELAALPAHLAPLLQQTGWQLPALHLRRGAGAYICGEESAMIESIEGKRGLPRLRPPYVAEVGLFGRPTLVQNLETLCWVPRLLGAGEVDTQVEVTPAPAADSASNSAPDSDSASLSAGAAGQMAASSAFAAFTTSGRHGRTGLRSFSVSGRVQRPGVHIAPAGISVRELIDEFCGGMLPGHDLYAYLPGGASGGILPASLTHLPLDFDTLQAVGCFIGSAAIVVLSQHDSARMAAQNTLEFFKHESCGQCTPCRVGTEKAVSLMAEDKWDVPLLQELGQVMMDASICGLGQAAPNPFMSVIKFFPHEVA